jgi:hypothetical protein|tara:strand:- start:7352 stop:9430 length:2079 start_codon:yes stop_codon:yes gene_type:complete
MSKDIYKETHYIFATNLGINMVDGATPDGILHVSQGVSGCDPSSAIYDNLILEGDSRPGATILGPDNDWAGLVFGSPTDTHAGRVLYKHAGESSWSGSDPVLVVGTSVSGGHVSIHSAVSKPAITIDSSQHVGLGTTSPDHLLHLVSTANDCDIALQQDTNSDSSGDLRFLKSRSGAVVQSGDSVGFIKWMPYDGTDYESIAAQIYTEIDGTPSGNDTPGRIHFSTTADGASAPTVRMTIKSDGKVGIGTTAPSAVLHVAGADGTPAIYITHASQTEGDIAWPEGEILTMGEWDGSSTFTPRFHIESTGDVGIGTTNPGYRLEINDASGDCLRLTYNDSNGSASNKVDFDVSSSGDLTIDPSGGDVTLSGNLAISGNVTYSSTSSDMTIGDSLKFGASTGYIKDSGGTSRIAVADGGDLVFYDDAAGARLRVGSIGDDFPGGIGIGTTNPSAPLHVFDSHGDDAIVKFTNTSSDSAADILRLTYSSGSQSVSNASNDGNNFILFEMGAGNYLGSIEAAYYSDSIDEHGDHATSKAIVLRSGGADFGEWMPVRDIYEWGGESATRGKTVDIEEGTLVYVRGGLVSKSAPGIPFLVTKRAIVCGNSPIKNNSESYGVQLSFCGQLPVKIFGQISEGDYIIPSASREGFCEAVKPGEITFDQFMQSIGVALKAYSGESDTCKVMCVIGVKSRYVS